MPRKYYLETSVVRSRLIGHTAIKQVLKDKLDAHTRITSGFVKMEFEKSLICDLIEFYFVFKKQATIDDAIKYWTEHFQIRKIKNMNYSIAGIFSGIEPTDIQQGLFKLRNSIKTLIAAFKKIIQRYDKNNSKCYFSDVALDFRRCTNIEDIEKEFARFYKVFKNDFVEECNIKKMFDASKNSLTDIIKFKSSNKGFKNQQNILKGVST